MKLNPTDATLFFSRQDPDDPRLGELVSKNPLSSENAIHLFGWPDEEGIAINGGRSGAAMGPDRIRKFLYKMTPAVDQPRISSFCDRGNLSVGSPLLERHASARALTFAVHQQGGRVLSFGGGHDYGFPDAASFLEWHLQKNLRPLVLNFDAHLDVRPMKDQPHSGTPFRRLLDEFQNRFDFLEIGLQPQCNSRFHWDWARAKGAELWMADEVRTPLQMTNRLASWSSNRKGQPLWVSLDIDVVTSDSAPGCSQSWASGLSVETMTAALCFLWKQFDVRGLGIYEVSPALDHDDRTAKLAALWAHDFLHRGRP